MEETIKQAADKWMEFVRLHLGEGCGVPLLLDGEWNVNFERVLKGMSFITPVRLGEKTKVTQKFDEYGFTMKATITTPSFIIQYRRELFTEEKSVHWLSLSVRRKGLKRQRSISIKARDFHLQEPTLNYSTATVKVV